MEWPKELGKMSCRRKAPKNLPESLGRGCQRVALQRANFNFKGGRSNFQGGEPRFQTEKGLGGIRARCGATSEKPQRAPRESKLTIIGNNNKKEDRYIVSNEEEKKKKKKSWSPI